MVAHRAAQFFACREWQAQSMWERLVPSSRAFDRINLHLINRLILLNFSCRGQRIPLLI